MGRRHHTTTKSHTLPSSPTHSSSSSDFEFTISISPRKSSAATADELFYKGQLLPLHLSLRRTLLSSDSTSSSNFTTSRASTASDSSTDSSRPSSVTDNDILLSLNYPPTKKQPKYFSLSKLSSVFRKENKNASPPSSSNAAVKRASSSAKDVICKYFKKVKPLYEKLSHRQQQQQLSSSRISRLTNTNILCMMRKDNNYCPKESTNNTKSTIISQSFSGNLNLMYPRRRGCISSCPSSMMSSPTHGKSGLGFTQTGRGGSGIINSDASSMEELQSAIQGAIAHCKNSMLQNNKIAMHGP